MSSMNLEQLLQSINQHPILVASLVIWSLIWKGLALWQAARRNEQKWFIVLLIVNTVGVLELIYLGFVAKVFSSSDKRGEKALEN